jgi:hypothetical protein
MGGPRTSRGQERWCAERAVLRVVWLRAALSALANGVWRSALWVIAGCREGRSRRLAAGGWCRRAGSLVRWSWERLPAAGVVLLDKGHHVGDRVNRHGQRNHYRLHRGGRLADGLLVQPQPGRREAIARTGLIAQETPIPAEPNYEVPSGMHLSFASARWDPLAPRQIPSVPHNRPFLSPASSAAEQSALPLGRPTVSRGFVRRADNTDFPDLRLRISVMFVFLHCDLRPWDTAYGSALPVCQCA